MRSVGFLFQLLFLFLLNAEEEAGRDGGQGPCGPYRINLTHLNRTSDLEGLQFSTVKCKGSDESRDF